MRRCEDCAVPNFKVEKICIEITTESTINFLHKLFTRFGIVDCLVWDTNLHPVTLGVPDHPVTLDLPDQSYHDCLILPKIPWTG